MTTYIEFIIYYAILIVFLFVPIMLYGCKDRRMAWFCIRMVLSSFFRKFYCYMLLIVVIIIHSTYFNAHGAEYGLMISSTVMFCMFRTSLTEKYLLKISDSRRWMRWTMITALIISAVPLLFTLGLTLTVIATGSCFYPSRKIRESGREIVMSQYRRCSSSGDYTDFIDDYFDESYTGKIQ